MKSYSYYLMKIFPVLFLIYGLLIFAGGIYASYTFYKLVDSNDKIKSRIQSDPALASKLEEIKEKEIANGKQPLSEGELDKAFNNIQQLEGLAVIGAFIGVLFIVGSLAVLYEKKWGMYLIIFSIILTWLYYFMLVDGIRENIILLLVLTVAGIFILSQKKFINDYQNNLA
jgi:hypothetical protein